jgi:hypothetical protein
MLLSGRAIMYVISGSLHSPRGPVRRQEALELEKPPASAVPVEGIPAVTNGGTPIPAPPRNGRLPVPQLSRNHLLRDMPIMERVDKCCYGGQRYCIIDMGYLRSTEYY